MVLTHGWCLFEVGIYYFGAGRDILSHHDAFKTFICGSIFDRNALCLGEKEGMLVDDECSSCYNRVGNF